MKLKTVECTCSPSELYADDSRSEWFTDEKQAIARTIHHKNSRTLYWGVHYNKLHVVSVKDDK